VKPVIVTVRRRIDLTARAVTVAVAVATVLAGLAEAAWFADLATHFRWQYAAASLVAIAVFGWLRRPAWALAAVALLGLNLYSAWPKPVGVTRPPSSEPFRVLISNVFFGNSEYHRVVAFVRSARPDAAVFVEVTPEWRRALAVLERELPHVQAAGSGRHGVLLMSRVPLASWREITASPGAETMLHARLMAGSRPIELFAVHANWPMGSETTSMRNRQLEVLAAEAASAAGPVVIAGDLNITPYSPHFVRLLADGHLRSAAGGRWIPTWPIFFPPAAIQIDHVLVSADVGVRTFESGPRVGSDHLPVVADLVF
jgi:endonuclease/exonuclease/phosphatase (EEP) superfamily protein YafD